LLAGLTGSRLGEVRRLLAVEHLDIATAQALLRKQLPAQALVQWEKHLAGCARCRQMLAAERAMLTLLDLGQVETGGSAALDVDHLLDQVPRLSSVKVNRRWLGQLGIGIAWLMTVVLAGLLAWQLVRRPAQATEAAADLAIAPELQEAVAANLDSLRTLAEEPWIIEHYEAVLALDVLLARPSP